MRSWWMQMGEGGSTLELRDAGVPEPGPRQLLVRMRAAGLNRGEFVAGHGLHGQPGTWKAIGGEGAGEVAARGSDAKAFEVGGPLLHVCNTPVGSAPLQRQLDEGAVEAGAELGKMRI